MTNAEKYLKDGTSVEEFIEAYLDFSFSRVWEKDENSFENITKKFFEQQAKPTLTEDEKVILKFIENFDYIGRDKEGLYYKLQDEDIKEKTAVIYNRTTNLFQFIKEGEEYPIEELLKGE